MWKYIFYNKNVNTSKLKADINICLWQKNTLWQHSNYHILHLLQCAALILLLLSLSSSIAMCFTSLVVIISFFICCTYLLLVITFLIYCNVLHFSYCYIIFYSFLVDHNNGVMEHYRQHLLTMHDIFRTKVTSAHLSWNILIVTI